MKINPLFGYMSPPTLKGEPIEITDDIQEGKFIELKQNSIKYMVKNNNILELNIKIGSRFLTFELEITP